jgi:hypothetical protein
MMLPILISVSEAPGSYCFWASAGPLKAAKQTATAAETASARERKVGITKGSLGFLNLVVRTFCESGVD